MSFAKNNFPIALTFDIDWAPDFAIEKCVNLLLKYNVPGTFFVTHNSALIDFLQSEPLIEIGIHPNFFEGSSHGKHIDEILHTVLELSPRANSLRTHGLFQSSNLFFYIRDNYKQLKFDFSLYLPYNPFIKPYNIGDIDGHQLTRVPYQWEDDLYFLTSPLNDPDENILFSNAYYQIFDFHPIHLYLNSDNLTRYNTLKKNLNGSLADIKETDACHYINNEFGTFSRLLELLENTPAERFVFATKIPHLINKVA